MALAAGLSLVARRFKQPMIIAYIVTGIIAGPSLLHAIHDKAAFESFSQIGIALLLFIIGLGLNVNVIKDTGKQVFFAFFANVIGVGGLGLIAGHLLGFSKKESVIIAAALLFSSTIIAVKALSDKKEQTRLYGQLATGVLLVEDLAATLALLVVSANGAGSGGNGALGDVGALMVKGSIIGTVLILTGGYVMPKMSKMFAASQELLYIFAIAWAFGIASVFQYAGFSIEVGALAAGVSLAHLPYAQAIGTKLKPLRDFFIVLFFIDLGESLDLSNITSAIGPAIVFALIAIIIKPICITAAFGILGYTKQTGFKAAIHLSQISEFSVILVVLALHNGLVVNPQLVSIITVTALITFTISTYLIKYDDQLYVLLQKPLGYLERKNTKRDMESLGHYPLILLGYREGGYSYVQTFRDMKKPYVVIDYDPEVIEHLERQHIHHLYGDVTDTELLEEIGIHKSDLVISTISDINTNRMLAKHISKINKEAIFVCPAKTLNDAHDLYASGAAYVLTPHFIGNEHINDFLQHHGNDKVAFAKYRNEHLMSLGAMAVEK